MKVNYKKWQRACEAFTKAGFAVGGSFVRDSLVLQIAKDGGVWLDVTLTDFGVDTVERAVDEMKRTYDEHARRHVALKAEATRLGLS